LDIAEVSSRAGCRPRFSRTDDTTVPAATAAQTTI
jgi:hypothetical protein